MLKAKTALITAFALLFNVSLPAFAAEELIVGTNGKPGNPRVTAAEMFGELPEQSSKGKYKVRVAHSATLGDDRQMLKLPAALQSGVFEGQENPLAADKQQAQGALALVSNAWAAEDTQEEIVPFAYRFGKILRGVGGEERVGISTNAVITYKSLDVTAENAPITCFTEIIDDCGRLVGGFVRIDGLVSIEWTSPAGLHPAVVERLKETLAEKYGSTARQKPLYVVGDVVITVVEKDNSLVITYRDLGRLEKAEARFEASKVEIKPDLL